MNKTCAIVVTFNRYKLLTQCLDALLCQTQPLDILLIDNNSTDGTSDLLLQDGYIDKNKIFYKKLPKNIGGAGGFTEGVKWAMELQYDYMWLMDDDAEPALDALEKLLLHVNTEESYSAYASKLFIGTKENHTLSLSGYGHRGIFDYKNPLPSFQKPLKKEDYESQTSLIEMASFVGILVPLTSVKKIGLPRDDFFIHHDDVEYSLRLVQLGKILMVNDSHIYHKEKRQDEKIIKKCCGVKKKRVRFDMLWIKYFGLRNSIYIALRYGKNPFIIFKILWNYLVLLKDIILFDDNKQKRIYFASSSVFDGIFGIFDNEKAKRILEK